MTADPATESLLAHPRLVPGLLAAMGALALTASVHIVGLIKSRTAASAEASRP